MSAKSNEFQRRAENADKAAEQAQSADAEQLWRDIACTWRAMARNQSLAPSERVKVRLANMRALGCRELRISCSNAPRCFQSTTVNAEKTRRHLPASNRSR